MVDGVPQGPVFQVIGRFELLPGREAQWDSILRGRVETARSAPGWLGVSVWAPANNPSQRVIVGRWRSLDDYDAWTQAESYIRTKRALASCQAAPPKIERFRSVFIVDEADT